MVCTLGNFSLKLLTRSNTGITRVHGEPQEHELGGRRVKLYPLFHPAAALRGTGVLEQLREDFSRLPALLAEPEPEQPRPRSPSRTPPARWTSSADLSESAAQTEAAGAELAARLAPGDVVLVAGELGTRQDHLRARRVPGAGGRGAGDQPHLHPGPACCPGRDVEVAHLDLYRLGSLAEEDPGVLDDYLTPERIGFVEWPGIAEPAGLRVAARVRLEHLGGDRRRLTVTR